MTLGCLVAFCLLEAFCRIWNPLALRVKAGRITVPVNQRQVLENHQIEKLDRSIVHSRNAIGLRGSDPPVDFDRWLSIIAVGGSTTECYYLSDDKTWPERLRQRMDDTFDQIWVNNAGLDGHSTFGHRFLLENYLAPLRPKVILYLVGINDVGNDQWNGFDILLPRSSGTGPGVLHDVWQGLADSSAAVATIDAMLRAREARKRGLAHADIGHGQLVLDGARGVEFSPSARLEFLIPHQELLPRYEQRLQELLRATRGFGIEPVLVTQPALYGPAIDDVTSVDLGRMAVDGSNGEVQWDILELYNDATRRVGRAESVLVIDLAKQMPKSSRYYYDHLHFTNEGAELVGRLLADALRPWLAEQFPAHLKAGSLR